MPKLFFQNLGPPQKPMWIFIARRSNLCLDSVHEMHYKLTAQTANQPALTDKGMLGNPKFPRPHPPHPHLTQELEMRTFLIMLFLTFPPIAFGSATEPPFGDVILEKYTSPFPASAFSGKSGPIPDPSGVEEIQKILSPYLVLTGDLGFLKISEVLSISSVEISEKHIDNTTIKQTVHASGGNNTESTALQLKNIVDSARLSSTIKSITSCVTGGFWEAGRSWGYEACYILNHQGEWVLISYRQWPWGTNEDSIDP